MAGKKKVLITLHHLGPRLAPVFQRLEAAGLEVLRNPLDRLYTEDELIRALQGVFATLAGGEPYTERVFREAKDLRTVARRCRGFEMPVLAYDTVPDAAFAEQLGISLVSCPRDSPHKSGPQGCPDEAAPAGRPGPVRRPPLLGADPGYPAARRGAGRPVPGTRPNGWV